MCNVSSPELRPDGELGLVNQSRCKRSRLPPDRLSWAEICSPLLFSQDEEEFGLKMSHSRGNKTRFRAGGVDLRALTRRGNGGGGEGGREISVGVSSFNLHDVLFAQAAVFDLTTPPRGVSNYRSEK